MTRAPAELTAASPIITSGSKIHVQVWTCDTARADSLLLTTGIGLGACP